MRRSVLALAALFAVLLPAAAGATCPVIPFVFSQGSVWNADQVNANFTSVRNCVVSGAGSGNVIGPNSSVVNRLAFFDNTTGTLLSDGMGSVTGYYYPTASSPAHIWGASFAPSQDPAAALAVEKFYDTSLGGTPITWARPALYSVCHLMVVGADTTNNNCRGGSAEGIDTVGGFGTFVEGFRGVGVSTSTSGIGGGAYGVIGWGQSYNAQFTIGFEAETIRTNGPDAPGPRGFNPSAQMMVGYLFSNGVAGTGNRADVGFLINPFNSIKTSTGFACGLATIEPTAGICFGDYGGSAIGLDLSLGGPSPHALAAVLLSNMDPIQGFYVDNTTLSNMMFMGADNVVHLGGVAPSAPVNVDGNLGVSGNAVINGNATISGGGAFAGGNFIVVSEAGPALVAGTWTIWMDTGTGELKASLGSAPFTVKVLAP
jgi:hypothetical protein